MQETTRAGNGRHLVLGGSGFIGRAVAARLIELGLSVTIADRAPPAGPLPSGLDYVGTDLATAPWETLLDGVAVVHHYAWTSIPESANRNPGKDLSDNVLPTIGLLDAMCRMPRGAAPRMVFASSGGTVYGRLRSVPAQEDHPMQPITAYGAGKAAAEHYITLYRTLNQLDCRIARLANPFGAGQDVARGQGAATAFLQRALAREPIHIWGDGEVMRDYIHISDAVEGLVALATKDDDGGHSVFNIGSGKGVTLNGIVAELEKRMGRRLIVKRSAGRSFDVPVSVLDITLAREILGWQPRLTFGDGLARTLDQLQYSTEPNE